jgi:hypothetical protein
MKLIETTLIEKVRSARHETFFFCGETRHETLHG